MVCCQATSSCETDSPLGQRCRPARGRGRRGGPHSRAPPFSGAGHPPQPCPTILSRLPPALPCCLPGPAEGRLPSMSPAFARMALRGITIYATTYALCTPVLTVGARGAVHRARHLKAASKLDSQRFFLPSMRCEGAAPPRAAAGAAAKLFGRDTVELEPQGRRGSALWFARRRPTSSNR